MWSNRQAVTILLIAVLLADGIASGPPPPRPSQNTSTANRTTSNQANPDRTVKKKSSNQTNGAPKLSTSQTRAAGHKANGQIPAPKPVNATPLEKPMDRRASDAQKPVDLTPLEEILTFDRFPFHLYEQHIVAVEYNKENNKNVKVPLEVTGGSQGSVLFRYYDDGRTKPYEVAIKVMRTAFGGYATIVEEIHCMSYIKGKAPNIAEYLGAYRVGSDERPIVYIIMNFIGMYHVGKYVVQHQKTFKQPKLAENFMRILESLDYFQKSRLIHRDIKLQNLLLDRESNVFIVDFGLAYVFPEGTPKNKMYAYSRCGTRQTMAPEVMIEGMGYTFSADLMSAIYVLFMILTADGIAPFEHLCNHICRPLHYNQRVVIDELYLHKMRQDMPFEMPPEIPPGAADIIRRTFKFRPEERMTLEEVIDHWWFKEQGITFKEIAEGANKPYLHRPRNDSPTIETTESRSDDDEDTTTESGWRRPTKQYDNEDEDEDEEDDGYDTNGYSTDGFGNMKANQAKNVYRNKPATHKNNNKNDNKNDNSDTTSQGSWSAVASGRRFLFKSPELRRAETAPAPLTDSGEHRDKRRSAVSRTKKYSANAQPAAGVLASTDRQRQL